MDRRITIVTALCALAAATGMTTQGCRGFGVPGLGPNPPAIVVEDVAVATLTRTLSVDLRKFPQTRRVTWAFGDGNVMVDLPVADGRTVVHTFDEDGTFVVEVHLFTGVDPLTRERSLLATGRLPIDVSGPNEMPVARIAVRDLTDAASQTREMEFDGSASTDADGQIVAYQWDFGDGETSETGAVVRHAYATTGRFTATLTVTDDRGGAATATQALTANLPPTAAFANSDVSGTAGADRTFEFSAAESRDDDGTISTYSWDFGDGSPAERGATVQHTFADPGDFDVTLTVTDDLGATATATRTVDATGTDPFVSGIDADLAEMDSTTTIGIDGFNFSDGATVQLISASEPDITATNVVLESDRRLLATFDLTGAAVGLRSLVVTDAAARTARLDDALRIVTPNRVRLTTSMGDIVLEMVDDAPITTSNFLQYVVDDFYDGTIFHRIVADFVVQGGGFLPGMIQPDGLRDPIMNEFSPGRSNLRGTVAMAKLGNDPDSATSQFFVNLADNSSNLDNQNGGFTVFARVVEGMEVVDAIAAVPVASDVPIDDVILIRAERE